MNKQTHTNSTDINSVHTYVYIFRKMLRKALLLNLITVIIAAAPGKLFFEPFLIIKLVSSCLADSLSIHDLKVQQRMKAHFIYPCIE